MRHARWSVAVANVLVPLVPQNALANPCNAAGTRRALREPRALPKAQHCHCQGHGHRVVSPRVHSEDDAAQRVLRPRSKWVVRPRIAESASPLLCKGVKLDVRLRFLVAHQNPVRGAHRVRLPANPPKILVGAPEEYRCATSPRLVHCGEGVAGGILVVP